MGTDAEIFVFDYEAYVTEVVPAFIDIFRGRRVVDWLHPFLKRRELDPSQWKKSDLALFPLRLNPDLSWVGPYDLRYTYDYRWQERWSHSVEGSEEAPPDDTAEQINWLFNKAVSIKCLGPEQFIGRSMTVSHYAELLPELGVKQDDPLISLLAALGKRGFIISYWFGSGFEGANGWLDPGETADLASKLDSLKLPRYEVSFAAMEQFREGYGYKCPGFSFEALSLSFVRTVATIAAAEDRGVLWGNGLMPAEYYSWATKP